MVSKDRKLRVWDLIRLSCVHTLSLPGSAQVLNDRLDVSDGTDHLFDPQAKPLLAVVEVNHTTLQLLVHVPAAGAASNFFVLYEISVSQGQGLTKIERIEVLWSVECGADTALSDLELRDVTLARFGTAGLRLWAVWDDSGNPLVKNINVLEELYQEADSSALSIAANSGPASWSTIHDARRFLPLHGSAFELAVSAVPDQREELADFFLDRIFDAGRFSQRSVEAALAKYEDGLFRSVGPDSLPPELHESMAFDTLRDHCFHVVGSSIQLETDPGTGNSLVPQYMSALRREWMRFVGYIESFQSAARWPLGFIRSSLPNPCKPLPSAPALLTRDYFVTAAVEDAASAFLRISTEIDAGFPGSSSGSRRRSRETAHAAADEKAFLISPGESANRSRRILANTRLDQNGNPLFLLIQSAVSLADNTPASELLSFWRDIATRFSSLVSQTVEDEVTVSWDQTLNEVVGDDAFRFLAETCRKIEGLEAVLTSWADLLVDQGGLLSVPASSTLAASQLDTVLLTDSLTAVLRERHQSACLLTFVLTCLWVSNGLEVLVPSMPALFSRAISTLKVSGTLLAASSLAGAPNVAPPAAFLPLEEDMTEQFGRLMNVSSSGHYGTAGPALSPLHYALQNNLVPASFVAPVHGSPSEWTPGLVLGADAMALYTYLVATDEKAAHSQPALTEHLSILAQHWLQGGYTSAADQILTAYPTSLAGTFLSGVSLLLRDEAGDFEMNPDETTSQVDSTIKFDSIGIALGSLDALADDTSGLLLVLPSTVAELAPHDASVAMYFHHLSTMFLSLERSTEVAWYGSKALALLQQTETKQELIEAGGTAKQALKSLVSDLSFSTFRAQVQLQDYTGAYHTIIASADKLFKSECIHSLVTNMCEAGQMPSLLRFNFSGLQAEVEKTLSFKARNSNPFAAPNYFHILYSYYIHRGDLKAAGAIMYQHAHHLAEQYEWQSASSAQLAHDYASTATVQAESLLCAISALALVPSRDAWFANATGPANALGVPARRVFDEQEEREEDEVPRGKSHVTHYVPNQMYGPGKGPLELVRLEDIRKEYALICARVDLAKQYPELAAPQSPLAPADAVALYARAEKFDQGLRLARALEVDASVLFQCVTTRAIKLSALGKGRIEELRAAGVDAQGTGAAFARLREEVETLTWDEARFLTASEPSSSWPGAPEAKAWRYLRLILSNTEEDERTHYYQVVLAHALDEGPEADELLPSWLTQWFTLNKPDLLIRGYMRVGRLEKALQTSLALVQTPLTPPPGELASDQAAVGAAVTDTFVPYTVIDELVHHVENPDPLGPAPARARGEDTLAIRTLAQQVRAAVADRLARLARLQTRREQAWSRVAPHAPVRGVV